MFKYSMIFIIIYWVLVFIPMAQMIIKKEEIEDNTTAFLFIYIMIPLFIMAFEYLIRVWE